MADHAPVADHAPGSLQVRRRSDGAVICKHLWLGQSFSQRFLGLMGRASLPQGDGLYLPTSSIHMMFMRFAIDALFVSGQGPDGVRRVVGIREHLPPWRGIVLPVRGAQGVIELPAGTLPAHGVRVGDELLFEPDTAMKRG
jgi:uncharacterized membrane protein (UPF0127 family)